MKKLIAVLCLSFLFLLTGCAKDEVTPTAVAEVVETIESTYTPTVEPTATATPSR